MHGSCCSLLLEITDEAEVRRLVGVRRNVMIAKHQRQIRARDAFSERVYHLLLSAVSIPG